jgi:hypothetical protein
MGEMDSWYEQFTRSRTVFTSQGQAKRFFVDKIIAQAVTEGTPLSETERQMLSFSESDPQFIVTPGLVEKLRAEISDADYEAKIAGLIERPWKRDVEADSNARNLYRDAFTILNQGDHYLLVMIDRALSRQLRSWWAFWR